MMDLSEHIQQYIANRAVDKLEKWDKETDKQIKAAQASEEDLDSLRALRAQARAQIVDKHIPENWLTDAARRAKEITLVTHAAKFTHSDSKACSIVAQPPAQASALLGSHSLPRPTMDVVGNAASLDVANLLLLEEHGCVLWQQIQANDARSLRAFSRDDHLIQTWIQGFLEALTSPLQAHRLTKQMYFPVSQAPSYHLIGPLFASSLCQEIYQRVKNLYSPGEAKQAREQHKNKKGCERDARYLPNIAQMNFGGSKPQNISLLNSRRGGKVYLLNAQPPSWQARLRLPVKGKQAFRRLYQRRVDELCKDLRHYLDFNAEVNNKAIRQGRAARVTALQDEFLHLAAEIRRLGKPGWSAHSALPLHQQCFLDPDRQSPPDDPFRQMLDTKSWQLLIAQEFSLWLNNQLKKMRTADGQLLRDLGDAEAHLWQQQLQSTISRLRNDLEYWV